jgi:tetratricopeptide (TPR) repeat protein
MTEHDAAADFTATSVRRDLENLRELLAVSRTLKTAGQLIVRDVIDRALAPVFIVDSPELDPYLNPKRPSREPFKSPYFWRDPNVVQGTAFWFFEKAEYARVVLPGHHKELRYQLGAPVDGATASHEEGDVRLRERFDELMELLELVQRELRGRETREGHDVTGLVFHMRRAMTAASELADALTSAHRETMRRQAAVDRYLHLVETQRIVGWETLLRRLDLAGTSVRVDARLQERVCGMLDEKRPRSASRNKADAQAIAGQVALQRVLRAKRAVVVLTRLKLLADLPGREAELGLEMETIQVRSPEYVEIAFAAVGGTGVLESDSDRKRLRDALATWEGLHQDLEEVYKEVEALVPRGREEAALRASLKRARGAMTRAARERERVDALVNELRAQCSYPGMTSAIETAAARLGSALEKRPVRGLAPTKYAKKIGGILSELAALEGNVGVVAHSVERLVPAVGSLRQAVRELFDSVGVPSGSVEKLMLEASDLIEETEADLSEELHRIVEMAYEGRVSPAKLVQATAEFARLKAEGEVEGFERYLVGALLTLARLQETGAGETERRRLLKVVRGELGRALSEGQSRLGASTSFAFAQHYYAAGDYESAEQYFRLSGRWLLTPVGALRHSTTLFRLAEIEDEPSDFTERAKRILEEARARVSGEDEESWRVVFTNSLIFMALERDQYGLDDLEQWIGELERGLGILEKRVFPQSVSANHDRAVILDTIALCWIERGRRRREQNDEEEAKKSLATARRLLKDATRLAPMHRGILQHLGLVEQEGGRV